jgi:hypothetical protein
MSAPNGLDDLVPGNPVPGGYSQDDLTARSQGDPVIAALMAAGYPVNGTPLSAIPNSPGLQPLSTGQDAGPITSPGQLPSQTPVPVQPAPETPATAPATAPYVPVTPQPGPQTPGAPAKPLASGDVKGATAQQNAALDTETGLIQNTELAKTNALAEHANTRASIYEGHATAQGLVDQQYQAARAAARNDANAETAAWLRDVDKKVAEEPVPGRWWDSQNKFGQVMYLMSLAFGAMAQAKNPQLKNIALEMITKETEADMAEQRDKLKRQVDALKMKGQVIDQKLQARIADSKDDHTLLVSRLAMVQQAALERANAPGPADQKAAMAEAASWAGQQRFVIAGERANKAYAERDAQLSRDAENARAMLTDKRERDITAATLQKDYDLARIAASVKLSAKDDPRMKDAVVLNPEVTGIRVVDEAGKPVATPLTGTGGLTVSKANEKEARQTAEVANEKYAAMKRVSTELGKGENINVLLKRNPQLISDIIKLGYQGARTELDPNGRVTDKDFVAGLEHELGGDLDTLSGRVATTTFSADQKALQNLVEKHLRDYPAFVGNKLGSLLDAAIPGYEGKVRVDWSPRQVEIDKPSTPTTQQIDASYGIKTPVNAPSNLDELKAAQALEKKGVQALPPYRPGSQDKVSKALSDFQGAMPDTIDARGRAITDKLEEAGDRRAVLEVEQAKYDEMRKSQEHLDEVVRDLQIITHTDGSGLGTGRHYLDAGDKVGRRLTSAQREAAIERHEVPVESVVELAKIHGITQLTGQDVLDIIKKTGLKPYKE